MNIRSVNDEELVFSHKPWKLPLLYVLVLIFILVKFLNRFDTLSFSNISAYILGILFLLFLIFLITRKAEVTFNSTSQTVRWSRQEIFKTIEGNASFSSIEDIIIQRQPATDEGSYRVVILLKDNQRIPIVYHYSSVEDPYAIKQEIEIWLKNNFEEYKWK